MRAWAGRLGIGLVACWAATSGFAADMAWEACRDGRDWDRRIAGCTEVLGRGQSETQANRAIAYSNRSGAYRLKGEHDRAIADYDEAIRLNPDQAFTYANRGAAYRLKGEYDRAIADLSEAIRLKPDHASAYANRGEAYRL